MFKITLYVANSAERKSQVRRRDSVVKPVTKADQVRAEIIKDLLNEGKTVEEIEVIIRCFGL